MDDNESTQRMFITELQKVLAEFGNGKLTSYSLVGILRSEVAWIELQVTREMAAELDRKASSQPSNPET